MTYLLDLGDGRPPIRCRDEWQALWLARVYVALTTGREGKDARKKNAR